MSTTPTLREAAQAVVDADDAHCLDQRRIDILRAALTQGAGEAVEPVGWRYVSKEGFTQIFKDEPPPKFKTQCDPLYTATQLQQAVAREREKWTAIANRLLAHCGEGECPTCSEIICPHGDTMHFHHDGCPTCEQEAAAIRAKGTHQ